MFRHTALNRPWSVGRRPEVFPSARGQLPAASIFSHKAHPARAGYFTDLRDCHAGNFRRNLLPSGKQNIVVLAAVQGQIKANGLFRSPDKRTRDGGCLNHCPNAAFFADALEIGGQAVAEIDHGGDKASTPEPSSDLHPGGRMKMARVVLSAHPSG